MSTARSLHERAVTANNDGHPARAVRLLDRAASELGTDSDRDSRPGRVLMAAILISRALVESELSGADAGASSLAEAHRLATELDEPGLLVRIHSQRAFMAIRTGRFPAALAEFERAEQLIDHADRDAHFAILLNAGNLYLFQGALPAARRELRRAATFADEQHMSDGGFKALHNLGYLEFLRGDLPLALRIMADAGAIDTAVSRGIWLLDRARVLAETGLTIEADGALAEAVAIFRHDRLSQDLGEAELERARCALISGDVEVARRQAMRARDRFRRRGNDRWRRSAELVLLQGDLAAGRPGKRLAGPALRLRQEFEREGVRLPAQTAALIAAEAHLSAGQPDAAREALADIGRARARDPITARLHAHYVRARLDATTGHAAAASRRAGRALDELAAYQATFGSIDLATAAAVHGRRLADLDLSIALASGRADQVLAAAERGRAVSNRLPAVRPPDDPIAAELLAELRRTVESLRAVEFERDASAPLLERRHQLEAQISARGWTRAGAGVVNAVVSMDALRESLDDATLVSFSRSNGALHAVTAASMRLELRTLDSADAVDEQVRRVRADMDVLAQPGLPEPLRGAVAASLNRSLAALDATLLAPLRITGRLVVVSTGLLGQLPWGLLPSLRGVPIVVAPSATAWQDAQARPRSTHRRMVAVAGPGLNRGAAEAAAVVELWNGRLLTGRDATAAAFAKALATARIVHVAAHGTHQGENPLFSSLRLADGPLFAHELDQTAQTPDHVVLSACELGLATVRPGDEGLGLTSVLLHLGTRSVVAGVARVADEAAEHAMAEYHARLAGGADCGEALADVLAEHPVPFVCFGAAYRASGAG
jgi:tetratricopeptide (TPR) repeat protein